MHRLAGIAALDYIDLHVYPARSPARNYLSDLLTWSDLVRSIDPSKGITIGESWLYKVDATEIAGFELSQVEVTGRDVYSYWEPLDASFIELLDQAARAKQIEVLTPFWSRYFFAYLDYSEASGQPPAERMYAASSAAFEQMKAGSLTASGRAYRDLAMAANQLVIGSVQPNHGPQTGPAAAQTVILNGANFSLESAPTVFFGESPATSVEVLDASTLRLVVPAGSGSVTVTVSSPDGRRVSKPNAYKYDVPPALISINPTQGPEAGGTIAVMEGSDFDLVAAPVQVFFGDVAATEITVYGRQMSARIPAGVGLGLVAVTVVNADGQSTTLADAYRYVPKPQVAAISPASGPSSGGTLVTISGQGFHPESAGTKVLFGGREASQVTVLDASTLQAVSPAAMGTVTVTVINPDLQTGQMVNAFNYVYPPRGLDFSPSEGLPSGGNEVWIIGAGFATGARVFFGPSQAIIQSSSSNVLKVIAPVGSGTVPIQVVNPDGQVGQAQRTYTYSTTPAPGILYFTQSQIPTGGGVKLYINGQNFKPRATVYFGSTKAKDVLVISSTWIQVTAPAGQGSVTVRVVNPDGKQGVSLVPITYSNTSPTQGAIPGDLSGIGEEIALPVQTFLPTLLR